MMSVAVIAAVFIVLISAAYVSYGRWISRLLALDNKRTTPAHKVNDGEDFVPTKSFYLFGQHFSAIAAAGPIAGPIAACLAFGWLPCLLWIALGVVLIGAVAVEPCQVHVRGRGKRLLLRRVLDLDEHVRRHAGPQLLTGCVRSPPCRQCPW